MNKSRFSFYTPSKLGTDSEITTNYTHSVVSHQNLECSIHEQIQNYSEISSYGPLTKHLGIRSQKIDNLQKKNKKRKLLTKILLTKYETFRFCFQQFKSLISENQNIYPVNSINLQDWLVKSIVNKTKITPQIAFFRTIFNARQQKHKKLNIDKEQAQSSNSIPKDNFKIQSRTIHDSVHPLQNGPSISNIKYALMFLEQRTKSKQRGRIKQIINKFHTKAWRCQIIDTYYLKVYRRMVQNQRVFIRKVKLMSKIRHDQILQTKRRLIRNFLDKAIERRQKQIFKAVMNGESKKDNKNQSKKSRQVALRSLQTKLQQNLMKSFYIWMIKSKNIKKQSLNIQSNTLKFCNDYQPTSLQSIDCGSGQFSIQQNSKKMKAARKMFMYLEQQFMGHSMQRIKRYAHMMKVLQKCAIHIACSPKINIQRSLWRLNINAFHD